MFNIQKYFIVFFIIFLSICTDAFPADRYWVGGTATWDATAGSKWATTSGGGGGSAVPTAADDVYFDSSSGSGTVTFGNVVARSINCTGFTGTWSQSATTTLTIGDGTAGAGNVALLLVSGMTYTPSADTRAITFVSTSGTQQSINFGGKKPGNVTFNGSGGNWILNDTLDTRSSSTTTITVTMGSVDFNGNLGNIGILSSSNSNTRSITLGASSIKIGASGTSWNFTSFSNLTFSGGSSTIEFTNSGNITFQPGGKTYGTVKFSGSSQFSTININSAAQYGTLIVDGPNAVVLTSTQTISSSLQLLGASAYYKRLTIRSNSLGSSRTITKTGATVTASYLDLRDITFSSGTTNLSSITGGCGDLFGNSGVTFSVAQNNYWVGNSGNWSDSSKWASTSGGTGGTGRSSLPQDTAYFDSNSFSSASQTVTVDIPSIGNLDFSGATNSPTLDFLETTAIYGSINLISAMSFTNTNSLTFLNRTSKTLNMAGNTVQNAIIFNMLSGTITLTGALTTIAESSGSLTLTSGTFNTGGYSLSVGSLLDISGSSTRNFNASNSTIYLNRQGTQLFNMSSLTGLTYNLSGSEIIITGGTVDVCTLNFPTTTPLEINKLTIQTSTYPVAISGKANINGDFTVQAPREVIFDSGYTQTFLGNFIAIGSSGNIVTIRSSSSGSAATFSKSSGLVCSDWLSVKDSTVSGGALWYAGNHSTNVSGNTGWKFLSCGNRRGFMNFIPN